MENTSRIRYALLFLALFVIGFLAVRSFKAGHTSDAAVKQAQSAFVTVVNPSELASHMQGNPDARYTLVYYTDYDCPYCTQSLGTIQKEIKKYPTLRVVVRDLPLSNLHPLAYKKAVVAECLVRGGENFFSLSADMFKHQNVAASDLTAKDLDLKSDTQLKSCIDDPQAQALVRGDINDATDAGLYSTPSIVLLDGEKEILKMNFASEEKIDQALSTLIK